MGKVLLKGGTVLSVDPDVGDLQSGDVLIEDDRIAGVQASIDADAEIVDCADKIVIPGFVDTHRHTWEAAIRNCAQMRPSTTTSSRFWTPSRRCTGPRTSTRATSPGRWSA